MINLLDFMINDAKWRKKLCELLRLREVIGSIIYYQKPYGTIEQAIKTTLSLEPRAYKTFIGQSLTNNTN